MNRGGGGSFAGTSRDQVAAPESERAHASFMNPFSLLPPSTIIRSRTGSYASPAPSREAGEVPEVASVVHPGGEEPNAQTSARKPPLYPPNISTRCRTG